MDFLKQKRTTQFLACLTTIILHYTYKTLLYGIIVNNTHGTIGIVF